MSYQQEPDLSRETVPSIRIFILKNNFNKTRRKCQTKSFSLLPLNEKTEATTIFTNLLAGLNEALHLNLRLELFEEEKRNILLDCPFEWLYAKEAFLTKSCLKVFILNWVHLIYTPCLGERSQVFRCNAIVILMIQ